MGFSSEILKDMSIKEIAPQLGLRRYVEGLPVVTTQDDTINGLEISNNRGQIRIRYSQKVYLYRALGLLLTAPYGKRQVLNPTVLCWIVHEMPYRLLKR